MTSREQTVAQLTTPTTAPSDTDCSICHEHLNDPVEVPCGKNHIFCRKCIVEWLEVGHTCPVCRVALYDDDEEAAQQQGDFDEEQYRHGLLNFIDLINAFSPQELRISVN